MARKFEPSAEDIEISEPKDYGPFTMAVDPLSTDHGDYFKGKVREAQVYRRVLTDEQMKRLARGEVL